MRLATSESSCAPDEKCQRQVSFSLSSCRARLISAEYCVEHRTSGVHGCIITWRTAIVLLQGAKLSVAGRRSRYNNVKMSSCCCTQSTTVHDAGELFHSAAAFQLNLGGLSSFVKHDNLIYKSKHGVRPSVCLSVWTKIGQCLEDSSSHCPFPVEFLTVSVFGHSLWSS